MKVLQVVTDIKTFTRKMFETLNGKKLRNILTQQYIIHHFHENVAIKPRFIPLGKDFVNKRVKIVNYCDEDEIEREEAERLEILEEENIILQDIIEDFLPKEK